MDWNERLEACRQEYIEVEAHQQAVDARTRELLTESRELKEADEARKNVLQGEINVLVDVLEASRQEQDDQQRLAEDRVNRDAAAVLQGIVDNNPPEASLAMLNGIQQQLAEQESAIPADA